MSKAKLAETETKHKLVLKDEKAEQARIIGENKELQK